MSRTQNEILAEHHAFNMQGEYIDKVVEGYGFDIRQWPTEVWQNLALVPIVANRERLQDLALKDEGATVPF